MIFRRGHISLLLSLVILYIQADPSPQYRPVDSQVPVIDSGGYGGRSFPGGYVGAYAPYAYDSPYAYNRNGYGYWSDASSQFSLLSRAKLRTSLALSTVMTLILLILS
ncbi:hypothetical protein O181_023988 [Austropuccinia psidii MF-1]|uniref:Uncharacterized protein n=1 Tax=Austropuccinia psidii MF-1 TaxID=1389203 RepID=A0A9Q3CJW0_9BASI|nr:hypothetical protein [Austropuccinia psidii MF-1]